MAQRNGKPDARSTRSRPPWWAWAGAGAAALVVVAAIGWAGWYRSSFHLWPWESIPPRIHWCGRDDDRGPGPALSARDVRDALGGTPRKVPEVPPLWRRHDVVAAVTEEDVHRRDPAAAGCATVISLRLAPGRHLTYELQGSL
jgi:hypothetical protein